MKTKRKARKPSKATPAGKRSGASTFANPAQWLIEAFGGSKTASGQRINETSALRVPAFYSGVKVIAQSIASLPLVTYRRLEPRGRERATDHWLYSLLHDDPNPEMTSFTLRMTLMVNALPWNNAYAVIRRRPGTVIASALWPVHPSRVDQYWADSAKTRRIYTVREDDGTITGVPSEDMIHIRGLTLDGYSGLPLFKVAQESLGLSLAAQQYGAKFFGNNAKPTIILSHPGILDEEASRRIRDSWSQAYGGDNALGTAVLEEGMQATPVSTQNNDAQFLETRQHQIPEACRWLDVSPSKVHDHTHSTFSNIEHLDIEFAKHTIRPWCVNIEQELNRKLVPPNERGTIYVEFNLDGLLRGDYESRWRAYQVARQSGVMSANEIRELENMNPIEGEAGDAYLINGNMISIETAMGNQVGVAPDRNADQPSDSDRSAQIEAVWEAYVPLFADVGARMASRECIAAKRIDVDKLGAWAGRFYQSHEESVTAALGVVFDSFYRQRCTITGEEYDPSAAHGLARRAANLYCQESRSKIVNGFSDQWLSRSGDAMVAHVKAVMQ